MSKNNELSMRVVTPNGVFCETSCDSVVLQCSPDADGTPNGSIGIRKGHTDAVIALGAGEVVISRDGEKSKKKISVGRGIATVSQNLVTVITDSAKTVE